MIPLSVDHRQRRLCLGEHWVKVEPAPLFIVDELIRAKKHGAELTKDALRRGMWSDSAERAALPFSRRRLQRTFDVHLCHARRAVERLGYRIQVERRDGRPDWYARARIWIEPAREPAPSLEA